MDIMKQATSPSSQYLTPYTRKYQCDGCLNSSEKSDDDAITHCALRVRNIIGLHTVDIEQT
jgi:hypothetical protein